MPLGALAGIQAKEAGQRILEAMDDTATTEKMLQEVLQMDNGLLNMGLRHLWNTGQVRRTGGGRPRDPYWYQKTSAIQALGDEMEWAQ